MMIRQHNVDIIDEFSLEKKEEYFFDAQVFIESEKLI